MFRLTFVVMVLAACGAKDPSSSTIVDAQISTSVDAPRTPSDGPITGAIDPADDGSSMVSETTASIPGATSDHTLAATIYTPSGVTAPALVVISPGFQMARTQYASYAHHLATWGFKVILTDYADSGFFADHQMMANDVGAVITYALALTPSIDSTKIALAGHSLGGDISVLAAAGDARVKAVVGWDPVDGSSPSVVPEKMTAFTAKLAVIGETTDATGGFMPCAPTANNFTQFYASAASPAYQMTVMGADHMDWVDDGTCMFCTLCTAGTAAPELSHTTTRRLNVAWLRAQLFGDSMMTPWLMAPPEVAAGKASITTK